MEKPTTRLAEGSLSHDIATADTRSKAYALHDELNNQPNYDTIDQTHEKMYNRIFQADTLERTEEYK